jgi:hypothetical protein
MKGNIMKALHELTSPELVIEFNGMAASDTGQALGLRPVTRFTDRATGLRRCEAARSSILAWEAGQAEEDTRQQQEQQESMDNESEKPPVRGGTNRDRLLAVLKKNEGKQVPLIDLLRAVYGSEATADMKGPLAMVMKGLFVVIASKGLPYVIRKEKVGREITYGLYSR